MSIRITLLTNIVFEPYWRLFIKDRFGRLSIDTQINSILFEEYQDNNDNIRLADIIIICLNFEECYTNLSNDIFEGKVTYETVEYDCINKCRELYSYTKTHSNASIVWFGFEDYYCLQSKNYGSLFFFDGLVERLNLALSDMLKKDLFIDLKRLIATVGIKIAYNAKGKYRWNAPYSKELISLMVDEIYKYYLITIGKTKKCLVLDCDNVLWGGVLSEDGIEGIQIGSNGLGRSFQDFQKYLLDLYYHGVILAVCSKNDESDVLRVFNEHTGMLLKEGHISCFRCNWSNKPDNIRDIADILNIGFDSVVFVDDSIFEIESIKRTLPEVTTVLYQIDSVYDELACFNLKYHADYQTVRERTSTYKTNRLRSELQNNTSSFEEYLSLLEMVVDIHRTTEYELARISELTQRTNKCTNGTRYMLKQLKANLSSADYELFTVCLSDKFSKLGVVGVIGIKGGAIDLFSLSCRALGRRVEERMIEFALRKKTNKVYFINTSKNKEIGKLFDSYGLIKVPTCTFDTNE